jgi:hypothetical protein
VSLDEKLDDVTQLWSPEEDGLYVGSPPKCSRRRWEILERRLVTTTTSQQQQQQQQQTTKTKWFRSDGSLAVLPDPLRPYLIRNIIPVLDSPADQFRPIYLPVCYSYNLFFFSSHANFLKINPRIFEFQNGKLVEGQTTAGPFAERQVYPLHVFISGIEFHHHWLFGVENVLAARLARQWADYSSTSADSAAITAAQMDVLARKLRALYQAHDEAVELVERLQFNGADEAVMAAQLQRIAAYRFERKQKLKNSKKFVLADL